MYERFISSSMLTGIFDAATSVIESSGAHGYGQDLALVPIPSPLPLSDVEVLYVERVVFDELAARLDLVAHQRREHQVRLGVVLGSDLQQRPLRRIHRGLPQRVRVHLAETLVAVHGHALL